MSSDKPIPEDNVDKDEQSNDQSANVESSESGISIVKADGSNSRYSALSIPPSPPKQVTINQLAVATKNFYNMSLVHEISVDSNFKVSKSEEPFERILRDTMHKAFWDIQRSHLEADPPNYEPAIGLMKEIRQMLEGLTLPHQTTLKAQIAATLDIESAEEEWRNTGRLRLESFAEPLVNMLAQWCAPVRDLDVARLRSISDPIEFFRQAFALLELMHMDLANFTIQEMRPYIRQQAGQYEREKFDSLLEVQRNAGIDGLAITRSWIREAYTKLLNTSSESETTPNNILREAYLALLTWPDNHDLPETVAVDAKRIYELSDCLGRTVTLASVILAVCNTVSNATPKATLSLKTLSVNNTTTQSSPISLLKAAVSNDTRGIIDAVPVSKLPQLSEVLKHRMLFVIENWQKSTSGAGSNEDGLNSLSEAFKERIAGQIDSVLTKEHPVFKLMFSRAMDFLRSTLSARPPNPIQLPTGFGGLSESASSPSSMGQTSVSMDPSVCALERPPMTRFMKKDSSSSCGSDSDQSSDDLSRVYDLALIASRLMPLVAHNRHVFGPHYAEIIQGLLKPQQPAQSSEQ